MKPEIPRPSTSSVGGGRLERFLFEDDHDFAQAMVNFLSSRVAVRRFVTRGLLVLCLLFLALLASVAAERRAVHKKQADEAARGQSPGDRKAAYIDDLSPLVADENAASSLLGSGSTWSAADSRHYLLGSMLTRDRTAGTGTTGISSSGTLTTRNNAGLQTQPAMDGSGAVSSTGGGVRVTTGAGQPGSKIPDSGRSLSLLAFALGLLLAGQRFRIYRHH